MSECYDIWVKKESLVIFILLLFIIPAIYNLFLPGAYTSHDLTHHIVRQIAMDKLLSEGQFPPRWVDYLFFGYGYPLFIFNYPSPSLIGEIFYKIGFNFVDSVKAVFVSSVILSAIGMYLFLRNFTDKLSSFLGSIFFIYAPIRFINIYVSAAVGSALALAFVPFIFYSIKKISDSKSLIYILIGSLSLDLLILSHNVTAVIFAFPIATFALLQIYFSKEKLKVFKRLAVMATLGLSLSAFFWLPSIIEKQYIRYDQLLGGFYQNHFVTFYQLIRSPWGYGTSNPGEADGMSFQIGLIHILIMLLALPLFYLYRKDRIFFRLLSFAIGFFILSVFLTQSQSLLLWENLPFLSYVQFPFRFLSLSIFCASIVTALFLQRIKYQKVIFILMLFLVIYANRNHWNINEQVRHGDDYYKSLTGSTASFDEHLPIWVLEVPKQTNQKIEILEGEGDINILENTSIKTVANINSKSPLRIQINQFYFPGATLTINNEAKNIETDKLNKYGLIETTLNPGTNNLVFQFKDTFVRSLSNTISLGGFIIWLGILVLATFKLPNKFLNN